jgi:hypothetical protein
VSNFSKFIYTRNQWLYFEIACTDFAKLLKITFAGLQACKVLPSHFVSIPFIISDIAPGAPITRFNAQDAELFLQRRGIGFQQDSYQPISAFQVGKT